ncbi:MAG: hemerythrin HHE cation-binding protein [Gammaproteobacteria bacterium]|nr:MAG: hemerythrin HHE cation-binding protein [Gammaproteobacteria bacterium]
MSDILDRLHQDHLNMVQILNAIERELQRLEGHEAADLPLVHDALHYLTNYADLYHHPVEDRLFEHLERLERIDDATREQVVRLREEHQALYVKGKAFFDAIREVESEVAMERREFDHLARDYLDSQRQHLDFEEAIMFPLARRVLEADDWETLAGIDEIESDPLFGRLVHQEYERLKNAL